MEAIINFISEHYPVIGLVLALLVAAIVATFKIAMYHVSVQNTKQKVDDLPCDTHTKILDRLETRIATLPCDSHRKAIVNIEKTLLGKKRFKANLTVAYSPRKLSELGNNLYQKSGMRAVLEENMRMFVEKIENENPTSALDVEDLSYSVLFGDTSEPFFKPVKDWIFNNPVFSEMDIDMSAICYVASFELRDAYLKKYPEILPNNIEEIDYAMIEDINDN